MHKGTRARKCLTSHRKSWWVWDTGRAVVEMTKQNLFKVQVRWEGLTNRKLDLLLNSNTFGDLA